jgi:hypothetical protein
MIPGPLPIYLFVFYTGGVSSQNMAPNAWVNSKLVFGKDMNGRNTVLI